MNLPQRTDQETTRLLHEELSSFLLTELAAKERVFYEAMAELNQEEPEQAALLTVCPLPLAEMRKGLDADSLFLELYQTEKTLYLFIMDRENAVKVQTVDLSGSEALAMVGNLLTGLKATAAADTRSHDYLREVRKPLARLYETLIAPLKGLVEQYGRVIIAPHLCWHYLPFQALYDKEEKLFLGDQIEIAYCPSASVLHHCLRKNRTGRDQALILANNTGDLPHADQEADLLAAAFNPTGQVFKNKDAHLGRAREKSYDVIHLACHGQFLHDQPFLSGIDMPPEKNQTQRTYLLDLFALKLECSLVTVSACDSGLSQFTSADELIGLSRGLFYAGAAAVMLSLWQVADRSTCYFMENFYWHYVQNRRTKTKALQLAMQAVKVKKEFAHPYYWAPFVVMGDWR